MSPAEVLVASAVVPPRRDLKFRFLRSILWNSDSEDCTSEVSGCTQPDSARTCLLCMCVN